MTFFMARQPLLGQGLFNIEASSSHSMTDTPHSVQLLRTREEPNSRDLYLTTFNTHNRQTTMRQVGFEPTISAREQPQTHALDRAATVIGTCNATKLNGTYLFPQQLTARGTNCSCKIICRRWDIRPAVGLA